MPNDREYYESWLRSLELREVELKAIMLMLEGQLTHVKKVLILSQGLGEYDDYVRGSLLMHKVQIERKHREYDEELDNLELDAAHCRFMIEVFNRDPHDT